MEMINARTRARRDVASTGGESNRDAGNNGHESSSEDEMNIAVTPKSVIATDAARQPYRPPLRRPPSVFVNPPPPVVGSSQSEKGRAPQKRQTMEERRRKMNLERAHAITPLSTYCSGSQSMPSSSNPQKGERGKKGEPAPAPVRLVKLGRGRGKDGPEHHSRNASAGHLNKTGSDDDVESRDENAPDSRVAPRTRQPFPLGDVETPHQTSRSSQDSSSRVSEPNRGSLFDQENREKEQTAKPFPLSGALASRSKQQCSVEIPSRVVASSSTVGSLPSTQVHGEAPPAVDDTPPRARQPFPLGTPSTSTASSGSKRPSSESQESTASPSRRIRLSKHQPLESFYIEDDSIMVVQVDDDSLCPFCDEPLPYCPSERLQALLDRARSYALPQPRSSNSKGLTAPFATLTGVCNQHRNETTVIPEGVAEGWPTDINFDELPARLRLLRPRLQLLIDNPEKSIFFQDVMRDVASMGALAAVGAQGQLATFQKARPGYYGERGLVRITQIIGDIFPSLSPTISSPSGIPPFAPLDSNSFVTRVLVPESARLLIMEDLFLNSEDEALRVLFASQTFGAAVYPDHEDDLEMDNIGIEMRVRLKKGRERLERHISEAERALRRSNADTEDELDVTSTPHRGTQHNTSFRGRKGKAKAHSRAPSVSSTKSSLISISSDDKDEEDTAVLLLNDKTPMPRRRKKMILGGPSNNNFFPSQAPMLKHAKHKSEKSALSFQRSASVASTCSDASSTRQAEWTRSIREQEDSGSSDEI